MAWTAGDIALIITATATSLTAIGGVATPFVLGRLDERRKALGADADALMHNLQTCVSLVDEVATHLGYESLRHAYLKSGSNLVEQDHAGKTKFHQFRSASRQINLTAHLNGIDPLLFDMAVTKILSKRVAYRFENGKPLVDETAETSHWMEIAQLSEDMLEQGTKIALQIRLQKR